MATVANVYGSVLAEVLESFPVESRACLGFHGGAPVALEAQARRAEAIRRQCDGCGIDAEELDADSVESSKPAVASVELFDAEDMLAGPGKVAWKLCQAATLNVDQTRAVALIAQPMQAAWERAREAAELTARNGGGRGQAEEARLVMPFVGTLVRLLLVGGGGCGKTRIFNMVLVPLLEAFYGPQGVMKEASSNKAARLLHGKTMHAANKLHGGSSLRTVHLRVKEELVRKLQNLYSRSAGALEPGAEAAGW